MDSTPYKMFGVNAQYLVSDALTVTTFVVTSYYHLAHPNGLPSYGGRWSWKVTPRTSSISPAVREPLSWVGIWCQSGM